MDDWTDGEMDGSLVLPTKTTKGFESDGGDKQICRVESSVCGGEAC